MNPLCSRSLTPTNRTPPGIRRSRHWASPMQNSGAFRIQKFQNGTAGFLVLECYSSDSPGSRRHSVPRRHVSNF